VAAENGNGASTQKIARYVLTAVLIGAGTWMLRPFLPALAWAVVLGIATAPAYERWLGMFRGRFRHAMAALSFTVLAGVLVIVPVVYGGFVAAKEGIRLTHSFLDSWRSGGLEVPDWMLHLPVVGSAVRQALTQGLQALPGGPNALLSARGQVLQWGRMLGIEVLHRIITLVFTLLALYFVYRNRERLRVEVPLVCRRLFGPTVERLLMGAAAAIRATVDGVVIVALVEGAIMAGVYAVSAAPHPILSGVVTGVFAMVPFAAPVVFGIVALVLFTKGAVSAAVGVFVAGSVMLFIADHFVRPAIIGGGAQLPFLWVLLGILGGIESFGLLGIFLGPALMAALVSIWRGWVADSMAAAAAAAPVPGNGGSPPGAALPPQA
jgi:predicted PurR-regulated permease PerM